MGFFGDFGAGERRREVMGTELFQKEIKKAREKKVKSFAKKIAKEEAEVFKTEKEIRKRRKKKVGKLLKEAPFKPKGFSVRRKGFGFKNF